MWTLRLTTVSLSLFLFLAPLPAQDATALQRAILIEEQEHDLKQAAALYQKIAEDETSPPADRAMARLRLGKALRRLGRNEEADAALRAAAAGTGEIAAAAKKLLDDQGVDEKTRELRARARKILRDPELGNKSHHLLFLGQSAVPEIVLYLEELLKGNKVGDASVFASLLWQLGGEAAATYLHDALERDEMVRRRTLVDGLPADPHPSVLPLALGIFADPDPSGELPLQALAKLQTARVPVPSLVPLITSTNLRVVRSTWAHMQGQWIGLHHDPDRAGSFDLIVPHVERALSSTDSLVQSSARGFLCRWGSDSAQGQRLLLRRLPQWPRSTGIAETWGGNPAPPDSNETEVLAAARSLGPRDPSDRRGVWLSYLTAHLAWGWSEASLSTVLELARLGYLTPLGEWLRAKKLRSVHEVLAALDGPPLARHMQYGNSFNVWLWDLPLEARDWLVLQRVWKSAGPDAKTRGFLLQLIGRTGADAAVEFLRGLDDESDSGFQRYEALMEAAKTRQDEQVRAALRQLLIAVPKQRERRPVVENTARRLLALGDFPTIEMIPAVNETIQGDWVVPIDGLHKTDPSPFTPDQLERAWRLLLDNEDSYWSEAAESLKPSGRSGKGDMTEFLGTRCAPRLLALFTEKVASRLDAYLRSDESRPSGYRTLLGCILSTPGQCEMDPAATRRVQELQTRCLKSSHVQLKSFVLHLLTRRTPTPEQRPLVIQCLRDPNSEVAGKALAVVNSTMPLTPREFAAAIPTCNPEIRHYVVGQLQSIRSAPEWDKIAFDLGRTLLRDDSPSVRISACSVLARCTDAAAVPDLLAALRDPSAEVRTAANAALQAIRFYHEQKAHWDRAFKRDTRVDANSAAEALLAQADPKQDKPTRLLAIRSLGALGKVEALPFLITYTKDGDSDLAAAAKTAITAIHAKAATGR